METIKKKYVVSKIEVLKIDVCDIVRTSGFVVGDAVVKDKESWPF